MMQKAWKIWPRRRRCRTQYNVKVARGDVVKQETKNVEGSRAIAVLSGISVTSQREHSDPR